MLIYWIWFAQLSGITLTQKLALMQHFHDPEEIYHLQGNISEIPEKIMAPVAENEIVGSVKVHINTEIIEQFDIRAANEIKLTKMAFFKKKISGFFACFF